MFVKINPQLGSNSDPRCKMINLMRAIRIVANSAAGSTPTCNVISGPTGTQEANQMITVINNAEAGGWAVETTSANAAAMSVNVYSDTNTQIYHLHLYNDTGKAAYPYKNFVIRTNPTQYMNVAVTSGFPAYPYFPIYYGVSNTAVYGGGNFPAYVIGNSSLHNTTLICEGNNTVWTAQTNTILNATNTNANNSAVWPLHYGHGEFYMAATADYLIFIQPNTYVVYCGTRYTNSWEDVYSDNPPAVAFIQQNWNYPSGHWMWTRYQNYANNTIFGPTAICNKVADFNGTISPATATANNTYNPNHPVTGVMRTGVSTAAATTYGNIYTGRINNNVTASNLIYSQPSFLYYSSVHAYQYGMQSYVSSFPFYAPVKDSNTGLFVPPAIPIVSQFYSDFFTPGGKLKGIYKSLSGQSGFINQYMTVDQDFAVANDTGGTDTYRAVQYYNRTTGGVSTQNVDTFLIRNA